MKVTLDGALLDDPRRAMTARLFDALDRDWTIRCREPDARSLSPSWARRSPELAGAMDVGWLIQRVQRRGHPAESDRLLLGLARLAPVDDLAARALLQALLPGLRALSRTFDGDHEEVAADVIAAVWELVRRYPVDRRPTAIAANVLLDVRQRVVRTRRRSSALECASLSGLEDVPAADRHWTDDLLDLVTESVRARRISVDGARLIVLTRVVGVPLRELAKATATDVQTVRRRRLRAEARLVRSAVA